MLSRMVVRKSQEQMLKQRLPKSLYKEAAYGFQGDSMARLVKKEDKSPKIIKVGEETIAICMCGLSKGQPLCDGSHSVTRDEEEGKVYKYVDGQRHESQD